MANLAQDDFSPIRRGAWGSRLAPRFVRKLTLAPVDLTGATITMKMKDAAPAGTVKDAAGTWVIDDAANGQTHYQYAPADVDTAGTWELHIKIVIAGAPDFADTRILEILDTP